MDVGCQDLGSIPIGSNSDQAQNCRTKELRYTGKCILASVRSKNHWFHLLKCHLVSFCIQVLKMKTQKGLIHLIEDI